MSVVIANNAKSTLIAGIGTTDTQLTVKAGEGGKFPALTAGQWFPLTLVKVDSTFEIVRATARSSDTITITRGQEGTTPLTFLAGDKVELRLTAAVISEIDALSEQNKTDIQQNKTDIGNNATNITSLQNVIGGYGDIVTRNATASTAAPTGGVNGDLWLQYE